jgi:hypothetical protein
MDLNQKLRALKEELNQREAEKNAAHARIILLRRKIKEFERVMKEAEPFFEEETPDQIVRLGNDGLTDDQVKEGLKQGINSAHGYTEGANNQ